MTVTTILIVNAAAAGAMSALLALVMGAAFRFTSDVTPVPIRRSGRRDIAVESLPGFSPGLVR